jgi:hypothetical protein
MSRANLVAGMQTIRLPKDVVEEMYRTSVRFPELLETLEVLLDKKTMRRIKLGENQYKRMQYVAAKGPREIRKVLSTCLRQRFEASGKRERQLSFRSVVLCLTRSSLDELG